MDSIAKTSLLTAAMRAAESRRTETEDRLVNDPYAEILAGSEGMSLREKAIAASGDNPVIAIRTAFMDAKISAALKEGFRQIVILAAGMDTRAYRLDFPSGTNLFELDRKEVLDYKKEKLHAFQPKCDLKTLAIDLREEWTSPLLARGFDSSEKTLWLIEGLLMYLEESQVLKLFQRLNTLAKPGDILLMDILSRTLLESPFMQNQLQFLTSIGAPWRFGTNEPEEFMQKLGWNTTTTQAGEFAPTRWPFPTAPRNVPNLPRGYFAESRKI